MAAKEYAVHPAAAIFPMMTEEEIADLAEDIKANGLKHPIILGEYEGKEVLVDGRNRLKACELGGIEPEFQKLNGEDQLAFILSTNVKRRHLNSGQRAMAVAMMYPKPEKGGRGKNSSVTEEFSVRSGALSMARTVLADSRALAEEVMSGAKFLDAAYQIAKAKLDANSAEEEKRQSVAQGAPDLYQLVQDSRMTLADALAALNERERKAKEITKHGYQAARSLSDVIGHVAAIAMAFQQGERGMIDGKKFPDVIDALNNLIKLQREGA